MHNDFVEDECINIITEILEEDTKLALKDVSSRPAIIAKIKNDLGIELTERENMILNYLIALLVEEKEKKENQKIVFSINITRQKELYENYLKSYTTYVESLNGKIESVFLYKTTYADTSTPTTGTYSLFITIDNEENKNSIIDFISKTIGNRQFETTEVVD